MGVVDAVEWQCVLCGHHIQKDWEQSNESASNIALSLNILPWKLFGLFRRLWGWFNECSTNESVSQMLHRWSRICWKWSKFWTASNKQTPENVEHTDHNQQRSATDSVRIRSWSGDSRNYWALDFDAGCWCEMCCGKIRSVTRAEGTSCCSC